MRQALISDHLGNSLSLQGDGELGFWPVDQIKDAGSFVIDHAQAGYEWYTDKVCAAALDPKVQTAAAIAAAAGAGTAGIATAGASVVGGIAAICMALKSGEELPPPPSPSVVIATLQKMSPLAAKSPAQATKPALPAGSIAAFDPKRGGYRVAVPRGLAGFGAAAPFAEVGVQTSQPAGARLVSLDVFNEETGAKPWFKNPLILGGIGAGVLAAGIGGYFILRRH